MLRFRTFIAASGMSLLACHHDATPAAAASPPAVASASPNPPIAAAATTPFEGEIVVSVNDETTTKAPTSITFDVKGDKVRYVSPASNVRAIADVGAQHAVVVSDARKSFSDFDTKPPAGKALPASETSVTKTPWSEKVAGLACDDWSIDDGNGKVDVCVARGIAFFDLAREPKAGKSEPNWAAALTREKAFPLRLVAHDKAGKEEYRAVATKLDRKKEDDSSFQVPAGFKRGDLSADVRTASLP